MHRVSFRYAWLIALVFGATLACNMLSGLGRDINQAKQTGQAVITDIQALATQGAPMIETVQAFATNEGGSLLKTAQAVATENPGLLQTAKAFATEGLPELRETFGAALTDNPEAIETLKAFATDRPDLMATLGAMATRYAGGGANPENIPDDIPLVDQATIADLYAAEGIITYSTTLDFKTVLAFYKEQMPANGWEINDSGTFESGSSAMLGFEKPDRTANLILTGEASDGKVSVVIQIAPK
jgi:predicted small secreted protein